ncbi:hypothetical protein T10_5563 [Trichinella papuae]|uniref:Uncharacterized protein n=1 Tax=Trichinella papuae TaxID=268474 RepID=A0A0V1N733_9BILA|nr:hypothetical protein T10_5563 [Trichinella papuae]
MKLPVTVHRSTTKRIHPPAVSARRTNRGIHCQKNARVRVKCWSEANIRGFAKMILSDLRTPGCKKMHLILHHLQTTRRSPFYLKRKHRI